MKNSIEPVDVTSWSASGAIETIKIVITKTCLFKYTENFTTQKNKIFR